MLLTVATTASSKEDGCAGARSNGEQRAEVLENRVEHVDRPLPRAFAVPHPPAVFKPNRTTLPIPIHALRRDLFAFPLLLLSATWSEGWHPPSSGAYVCVCVCVRARREEGGRPVQMDGRTDAPHRLALPQRERTAPFLRPAGLVRHGTRAHTYTHIAPTNPHTHTPPTPTHYPPTHTHARAQGARCCCSSCWDCSGCSSTSSSTSSACI